MSAQKEQTAFNVPGRQAENQENNFLYNLRFIISILQFGGLLPRYIQHRKNHIVKTIWWKSLISCFGRGFFYVLAAINFYVIDVTKYAVIFNETFRLVFLLYFLTLHCCCFYICGRNGNQLIDIFNKLLNIDEELQRFYKFTILHEFKYIKKILVIFVILRAFSMFGYMPIYDHSLLVMVMIPTNLLYILCLTTYVTFVSCLFSTITKRFAFLNYILYSYTENELRAKHNILFVSSTNSNFTQDVLFVFQTHNKLLGIYKVFNEYCSLVLVMWMGYVFAELTLVLHEVVIKLATSSCDRYFPWLAHLISFIIPLAMLCLRSEQMSTEANHTVRILSKVYRQDKKEQYLIDKFLTKNIKQNVEFTAYGFYVINKATLFKIFSAVTTYLVILIQFKQLEETHKNIAAE